MAGAYVSHARCDYCLGKGREFAGLCLSFHRHSSQPAEEVPIPLLWRGARQGRVVERRQISAAGDFAKILFFPERQKGRRCKIKGDIKHAGQSVFCAHKKLIKYCFSMSPVKHG